MPRAMAYLSGEFLPLEEATVPVWDYGIVQGATVTDMVRTFHGEPFRLESHLARFDRSCQALGIVLPEAQAQLAEIVGDLAGKTADLLGDGRDFGIVMFATPGPYAAYSPFTTVRPLAIGSTEALAVRESVPNLRPTLCIHPFALSFSKFAEGYRDGIALASPAVRHVPGSSIPPQVKYRSRLHWYLADREVRRIDPDAAALLLDEHGCVTETNSGNLFAVVDNHLLIPRAETTLAGISQAYVIELARASGLTSERIDMTPAFLATVHEVFLSSTTYCLLPVTRYDGQVIGDGQPGSIFTRLLAQWSEAVGVDIVGQARRFAA
ncbi:MAG: aminotransferase class IV [Planctomycetaceae bacterium]